MDILVFLLMLLQLIFLDPLSFHVFVPIATPSAYLSVFSPSSFIQKLDPKTTKKYGSGSSQRRFGFRRNRLHNRIVDPDPYIKLGLNPDP